MFHTIKKILFPFKENQKNINANETSINDSQNENVDATENYNVSEEITKAFENVDNLEKVKEIHSNEKNQLENQEKVKKKRSFLHR